VFEDLLRVCPDLEKRLLESSEEEIELLSGLVSRSMYFYSFLVHLFIQLGKGVSGARADDTKGMKSAIIDWITLPGPTLEPPLSRKIKTTRGFHHEKTGALLCPAGVDWSLPQYVMFSFLLL
jgi:hypothetical protein